MPGKLPGKGYPAYMAIEAIQLEGGWKQGFKAEGKMHQAKVRGVESNLDGMYLQLRKKKKIWQLA
jgi:hypothetical protein